MPLRSVKYGRRPAPGALITEKCHGGRTWARAGGGFICSRDDYSRPPATVFGWRGPESQLADKFNSSTLGRVGGARAATQWPSPDWIGASATRDYSAPRRRAPKLIRLLVPAARPTNLRARPAPLLRLSPATHGAPVGLPPGSSVYT